MSQRTSNAYSESRLSPSTRIGVPKESWPDETRVALVPEGVRRLVQLGAEVTVEANLGGPIGRSDAEYAAAGADIIENRRDLLKSADVILRVRRPINEEIEWLKPGSIYVGFLNPFFEPDLLRGLAARGISAVAMELIPRLTRAQSMDALSSQASLAGYVAVLLAATHLPKIFPLMMTAAGTIAPAKVLVIGAGVAGLQAVATARRLGARVEVCDTRPAVEEEVRSLGARFLRLDVGETHATSEGYAEALSDAQIQRQREALQRFCAGADVILTAAQVFGQRAPVLLTQNVLATLKPGTVVVDLSVESGGNVEGIVPGEVTESHGITLIALRNLPGRVPVHASQTYSANLVAWVEAFWDKQRNTLHLNLDDEIVRACLVTHGGQVCHKRFRASSTV